MAMKQLYQRNGRTHRTSRLTNLYTIEVVHNVGPTNPDGMTDRLCPIRCLGWFTESLPDNCHSQKCYRMSTGLPAIQGHSFMNDHDKNFTFQITSQYLYFKHLQHVYFYLLSTKNSNFIYLPSDHQQSRNNALKFVILTVIALRFIF